MLIGNKCDNDTERQVSTEEAAEKAKELGLEFMEVSAKKSTNVENAFHAITKKLVSNREKQSSQASGPSRGSPVAITADLSSGGVNTTGCVGCASGGGTAPKASTFPKMSGIATK